ncbi:hypothetical protein [Thalassospira sp. CH_XMU1448-2]|jgi:hypothetical protein|uniref:hypothetical protein n=1 Tax=Thalassospira sp. CH_XMU1448-2 TaxID=3107773 RepID=UPI00300B26C9
MSNDKPDIDNLRKKLSEQAVAADLPYASFYFEQCAEHFEQAYQASLDKIEDRSAFIYAMQ